jgi:hypothetical protein
VISVVLTRRELVNNLEMVYTGGNENNMLRDEQESGCDRESAKSIKQDFCDRCETYNMLAKYRGEYLCRDCFVGDYGPEYVEQRKASLIHRGDYPLV